MTTYTTVAAAEGAWTRTLRVPAVSFVSARRALTRLSWTTGWPVAAFLPGDVGAPVGEVVLYRDPSRSFGTPDVSECAAAVRALIAATGWSVAVGRDPEDGVLVGLGLREGYEPGAVQHSPAEAAEHLRALGGTGRQCRTARLVSVRFVDGGARWYDEVGVLVHAEDGLLPAVEAAAGAFRQHRYVVTHLSERRTYALQRLDRGAVPS